MRDVYLLSNTTKCNRNLHIHHAASHFSGISSTTLHKALGASRAHSTVIESMLKGYCKFIREPRVLLTYRTFSGKPFHKKGNLKRVLSGIQPTGSLHIGNYLGALKQWVDNQDKYDNFFFVVDMHAVTATHDPRKLRAETLQAAALYIAAGIDPNRSCVFVQSHVPAHAELTWLLNCTTPISWLERMVQFKEKAVKQGENVSMGLFDYPVLMAADILLYQSDLVPVGEDQRQHLELTREICRRFNDRYCKKKYPVFHEPAALIVDTGARVMSLQDGTCKMSKSAENDNSRINLLDPADVIKRKVKRCKTDAWTQLEWDNCDRPECMNLLRMYQAVTGLTTEQVISEVRTMSWSQFKPRLADSIIAHLEPIQVRYKDIVADEEKLVATLHDGKEKAQAVANTTLLQVKEAMGFYNI